jgi:hypothetical protein
MPTSAINPFSITTYRRALSKMGWLPTTDTTQTDTVQVTVHDTKGKAAGILLLVDGKSRLFLRVAERAVIDPQGVYEALVLGWNMQALLTAVPTSRDFLRVYNTTYKPNKDSIIRGQESPVAQLSLADVLDIDAVQRATGQLLLLSPDTWRSQNYQQFLTSTTGQRRLTVDNSLIRDLQNWRLALLRNLQEQYPSNDLAQLDTASQQILDEIIFIRFCEDRGLTKLKSLFDLAVNYQGNQFLTKLQSLLGRYDSLFDTSLFEPNLTKETRPSPSVLQAIIAESYEFYKFDLLDVDLLGRIYEVYLSYELKSESKGLFYELQLEQRKDQGIYYTPSYIVDYLVERAFYIFQKTNNRRVSSALDPACGSGIFLTTALKKSLEQHHKANLKEKRELLENTIYGMDLDNRAVQRAAQSLYYTLLTGENSQLTGQHLLPKLLEDNLFVGDSLLNRQQQFPGQPLDIILSNPPYKRISGDQLDQYRNLYKDVIFNQSDLCWLMLIAAIDNLIEGGVVAFIVPDNLLRTIEYKLIRKYILDTTMVLEISYLNYQAFESTSLQSILLMLQRESSSENRKNNTVEVNYYSTPGVFEREAFDSIPQSGFYNEELDYVFNVQLTAPIQAIYEKIKLRSETVDHYFEVTQGIKPNRQYLYDAPINKHCKKYLLGKDIQPFLANWSGTYIDYNLDRDSNDPNIRPRDPKYFENSMKLIVRKIVGDRIVACLDTDQCYVDSSAYILFPKSALAEEEDFVFFVLAVITSRITKFYYQVEYPERKMVFPQIRGRDIERLPLPSKELRENTTIVKSITAEAKHLYNQVIAGKVRGTAISKTQMAQRIDGLLVQLYGLTNTERSLIESYLERL